MISIEELADILNQEIDQAFITALNELWNDGDPPVDPEHPDMEEALEKMVDRINELELPRFE